jgi:hypothetical protein
MGQTFTNNSHICVAADIPNKVESALQEHLKKFRNHLGGNNKKAVPNDRNGLSAGVSLRLQKISRNRSFDVRSGW